MYYDTGVTVHSIAVRLDVTRYSGVGCDIEHCLSLNVERRPPRNNIERCLLLNVSLEYNVERCLSLSLSVGQSAISNAVC